MKVKQLITELQKLDPELIVTVPGYESGLDPIEGIVTTKCKEFPYSGDVFGKYEPTSNGDATIVWLYGPHRHHYLPWEGEDD